MADREGDQCAARRRIEAGSGTLPAVVWPATVTVSRSQFTEGESALAVRSVNVRVVELDAAVKERTLPAIQVRDWKSVWTDPREDESSALKVATPTT